MTGPAPVLSVVVLCYRSERDLIPIVERLHRLLSLMKPTWEIILVGNYLQGREDSTPEVVRELERKFAGIRSITLEKKAMMGWDMRTGLQECRGEYLAVIDGDGQFPLEAVITCFMRIIEGGYDLVQTYRVRRGDGMTRRMISIAFNAISRLMFPGFNLNDINSKPKILTRALYEKLQLCDDGWFIDAEIVLKANLMKAVIAHEPIHFYKLQGRHSFIRPAAIMEFVRKLLLFHRDRDRIKASLSEANHQ
ncbi:MAG: glycosyltransferase family 2 protein [Candidatus Hydrogenedentota bacterium]